MRKTEAINRDTLHTDMIVRAVALTACAAVTLPRFLSDEGPSIRRMTWQWATGVTLWWLLPLALFLLSVRTRVLLIVGAVAYVATAAVVLAAVYEDEHSTAAFGIVFTPICLCVAVAMVVGGEVAFYAARRRWR